ncbi:MAG: Na+/H+ antiporter NhaA [Oricola sp.]
MVARKLIAPINEFLESETSGGLVLMASAVVAMIVANSPLVEAYEGTLDTKILGLSVLHWINDALMAVFFLLVGLEIKREFLSGELSSWSQRILPAIAAAGGMAVPAIVYIALNTGAEGKLIGWAVPSATDIAFALGIMALLGPRVPASLKIFLMALAIIDDLGAVVIIAVFYTNDIHLWALAASAGVTAALVALNLLGVKRLLPYLVLGVALWVFMHESGVHATIAGVILALTIPSTGGSHSPLMKVEHVLARPVAFLIVPIFGFANAGIPFSGMSLESVFHPVTLGIAAGLFVGKQVGVFAATALIVWLKFAVKPYGATWAQIYGVSLLCGVGFTMSLFIGHLAFPTEPQLMLEVKLGVMIGSIASGVIGAMLLSVVGPKPAPVAA